jgi:MoaA/NifB/PqqE/SkfB family radical SAM enzyme
MSAIGRLRQYAGAAINAAGLVERPLTGPLYAQVSICDPCDQRCIMCPYHPPSEARPDEFGGARPGVMSYPTFARLVDDFARLGTRQIDLVGRGEPLLNPRVIDMVGYARQRGLLVTMISNGSHLSAEMAAALVDRGLDRFRLSLDAGTADTYARIHVSETPASYAAIKANLRGLAAARKKTPHLTVSFTISRANHRELCAMIEATAEMGADAAFFQHVLPLSAEGAAIVLSEDETRALAEIHIPAARARARALGVDTNLGAFAEQPRPERVPAVPCYVGSFFTAVLGNGNVMPCCQTRQAVGSLEEASFAGVWTGERYAAFRRAARKLPQPSPALATCECDRCYFRPHNISVHNLLHPFSRLPAAGTLSVDHLLRMSRLDRREP